MCIECFQNALNTKREKWGWFHFLIQWHCRLYGHRWSDWSEELDVEVCQRCGIDKPENMKERIEQAGKRVHLLLYGGERENDPQYTEWRNDLETAILDWINIYAKQHKP